MSVIDDTARQSARPLFIQGGGIITMDPVLGDIVRGDVHVRDGRIAEVGEGLVPPPDAEVVDARTMIVMPGFIDGHRHLWEGVIRNALPTDDLNDYFKNVNEGFAQHFRPEDAYLGTLVGALGAIDAGITTVFDWSHIQSNRDFTRATIAGLRESGLRTLFAYGPAGRRDIGAQWPEDLLSLKADEFPSNDALVTLALGGLSPEHVPHAFSARMFDLARDADVVISCHAGINGMGEGGEILRFAREGRLGPKVNLVHCNTLNADEWRAIADTGTTVSVTPSSEMQMGQGVPPIQRALDVGMKISLGVDVETSLPGDLWTQMRIIYALQRMNAYELHFGGKERPSVITCDDLLDYITIAGARATAMEDRIGSLSPGKQADIVLLEAKHINVMPVNNMRSAVALNMDGRNVDTVMVAGRILKRHGRLLGVDLNALACRLYDARDHVFPAFKAELPSPVARW
uniref:amidohydrolase family protein n=1 Tax=uncultured Sphingomonas sp. TaxID=158754 RepID=UPI0035CB7BE5